MMTAMDDVVSLKLHKPLPISARLRPRKPTKSLKTARKKLANSPKIMVLLAHA
jgi:hypothetical protein